MAKKKNNNIYYYLGGAALLVVIVLVVMLNSDSSLNQGKIFMDNDEDPTEEVDRESLGAGYDHDIEIEDGAYMKYVTVEGEELAYQFPWNSGLTFQPLVTRVADTSCGEYLAFNPGEEPSTALAYFEGSEDLAKIFSALAYNQALVLAGEDGGREVLKAVSANDLAKMVAGLKMTSEEKGQFISAVVKANTTGAQGLQKLGPNSKLTMVENEVGALISLKMLEGVLDSLAFNTTSLVEGITGLRTYDSKLFSCESGGLLN